MVLLYTVKTFRLLQPYFGYLSWQVCGVHIMKFKECFQTEDLEIRTSSLIKPRLVFITLAFLEKLHSYVRNASNETK